MVQVGDCVLVKFPNHPRGVNPKFYKKSKGVFRVTKIVGKVNLMVQLTVALKPILVHVDRVRHLTLKENEASFDLKLPKGEEIDYTDESSDSESDPGTEGASQGKQDDDENTNEQDFSGYVDTPENQDMQGVQDNETQDGAESRREPEPRLTRAGARRGGIYVEEFPLPRYCHSSSRGRNKQN